MVSNSQTTVDITLQDIIFQPDIANDRISDMYYRSTSPIMLTEDHYFLLKEDTFYEFLTYINSLSIRKWRTYTYAHDFALRLDLKGKFEIELMGHYIDSRNNIQKEWFGRYMFDLENYTEISLPYPEDTNCSVVSFQISPIEDTFIRSGKYCAKTETVKEPFISLVTTTFKKESYVKKNIALIKSNIFDDNEYSPYFQWFIIDNGRTLDVKELSTDKIKIVPNGNTGGAGGFTRGMIETLNSGKKATHVLLMDDDVEFFPQSFKRLLKLLMLMRPEYSDRFISGAMLEVTEKNIQHEDVGVFRPDASHGPYKPRYDLNLWDSVVRNEEPVPEDLHQYAGWWYCCIPVSTASGSNLPLPFFVRGDDVEYSIRNSAKFITMNGICIWHEGFGGKFSSSMEFYQVHRNDLILTAIHDKLSDVQVLERIRILFWDEIYKFNYKGAELLLDALEDFLKGPEFIESLDGEKCMKEKSAKDNKLIPMTDKVRRYVDYGRLYEFVPMDKWKKFIYDHTCNGQKRILYSDFTKVGVIPYGWGNYPAKQSFASVIYAIDPIKDAYVEYRRSIKDFKRLSKRFKTLKARYLSEYETISKKYKAKEKTFESEEFWKKYLKMNKAEEKPAKNGAGPANSHKNKK